VKVSAQYRGGLVVCHRATGVESAGKNRQKSAAAIVVLCEQGEGPNVKYGSRTADLNASHQSRSIRESAPRSKTCPWGASMVRAEVDGGTYLGRFWCRSLHDGCWANETGGAAVDGSRSGRAAIAACQEKMQTPAAIRLAILPVRAYYKFSTPPLLNGITNQIPTVRTADVSRA